MRVDLGKIFMNRMHIDLSLLDRPFVVEEVKSVVFKLGGDKALGPDGFPLHFFKKFLVSH